jgi:nucleotide-binding universal stress UspA family protein
LATVHTLSRLSSTESRVALEAVNAPRLTHDRSIAPGRRLSGTIVCVVDDLEVAESALQAARALADRFKARIILVSVAHAAEASGGDRGDEERRITGGDPAETVARISMDEAADLIIVGARRGLRPGSFRSPLAEDLTATAPCAVVIAPPQAPGPARRG